jgi:hypothetical protein
MIDIGQTTIDLLKYNSKCSTWHPRTVVSCNRIVYRVTQKEGAGFKKKLIEVQKAAPVPLEF